MKIIKVVCLNIFVFFSFSLLANPFKQVDSLVNLGLFQSALQKNEAVLKKALQTKNQELSLQGVLNQGEIWKQYEEEPLLLFVDFALEHLPQLGSPGKEILYSLLAEIYDDYYKMNRFRLNRHLSSSAIVSSSQLFSSKELPLASSSQILGVIDTCYTRSLRSTFVLKNTSLSLFSSVVNQAQDTLFCPSVFDFLAHRYWDYYQQVNRVAEVNDIFQLLTSLNANNTNVLCYLNFKKILASSQEKDSQIASLVSLYRQYPNTLLSGDILYQIAMRYYQRSLQLTKQDTQFFQYRDSAHYYVQRALQYKDDLKAQALLSELRKINLECLIPAVILPNQRYLAPIESINVDSLSVEIYKLNEEQERIYLEYQYVSSEAWQEYLIKADVPKQQMSFRKIDTLPFPPLHVGAYYIVLNAYGDSCEPEVIRHFINVSNLTAVFGNAENGLQAYSLNRTSGKTLASVKFQFYHKEYNHQAKKNDLVLDKEIRSDKNGFVYFKTDDDRHRTYTVKVQSKTDHVWLESGYIYTAGERYLPKTEKIAYIYTDRGLYRPGQTVEIKAILIENKNGKRQVSPNEKVDIEIRNPRGKLMQKKTLHTNAMGSIHYSYPVDAETEKGEYSIRIGNDYASFGVEAYKLPQFEVLVNQPSEAYALGDTIVVSATAKLFSGPAMTSANVKYSVYKTYASMWLPWIRRADFIHKPDVLIKMGDLLSDEKGEFQVEFITEKEVGQVICYKVVFDVTDINGETQTNSISLPLGDQSIFMNMDIPERIQLANENCFRVQKVNIYGEKVKGEADIFMIHQRTKDTVFSVKLGAEDSLVCLPKGQNWNAGNYLSLIVFKDEKQNVFTSESSFVVFDKSRKNIQEGALWCIPVQTSVVSGENAEVLIGTSLKDVYLFYQIQTTPSTRIKKWVKLSEEQVLISIPTPKDTRYNPQISCFFVKDNQYYGEEKNIKMKPSIPALKIQIDSLSPILKPGTGQTWRLKVLNLAPKQACELMVAMYDASLEAIRPFQWQAPYPYYINLASSWNLYDAQVSYRPIRLSPNYRHYPFYGEVERAYPSLNWTGFGESIMLYKTMATGRMSAQDQGMMTIDSEQIMEEASLSSTPSVSPKLRSDFRETAFFFPQLTYKEDSTIIEFTVPDALTKWKIQGLAHTSDFNFSIENWEVRTQKEMMLFPQFPRFLYGGDSMDLKCKIQLQTTEKIKKGEIVASFYDEKNRKLFSFKDSIFFDKDGLALSSINLNVPDSISTLLCEISVNVLGASWIQDGLRKEIPVLSPYILQKNTLNFQTLAKETDSYSLIDLWNKKDHSKKYHSLQIQGSANPIWYAIYALPSLQESGPDNSQTAISELAYLYFGHQIIYSNPLIAQALQHEKKDIALGFSIFFKEEERLQKMDKIRKTLEGFQMSNGGFVWFQGGRTNLYLSLQIAIQLAEMNQTQSSVFKNLISYLDDEFLSEYTSYYAKDSNCKQQSISLKHIQYLYLKSVCKYPAEKTKALAYWDLQAKKYGLKFNLREQGILALYYLNEGQPNQAKLILNSIRERSLYQKNTGRYWKKTFYTYDIQSQALLIRAFSHFPEDSLVVEQMKNWLISQKRTQDWGASIATLEAIKSLNIGQKGMSRSSAHLFFGQDTLFSVSNSSFSSGHFQKEWTADLLNDTLGVLKVQNTGNSVIYGGVYSSYTQNVSKQVSAPKNKKNKSLQIERAYETLKDGRLVVKLQIYADQDFDFIHVQSEHPASFEMVEKRSGYQWKSGLFYYQSQDDHAVHFYLDKLPKGTYVLEYEVFLTQKGKFSDGGAWIESLYAPEFSDRVR